MARQFLEAIQPAHLEVSLATLEQIEDQTRQVERQWRPGPGNEPATRPTWPGGALAVEPENRLVARNLEKDSNETRGGRATGARAGRFAGGGKAAWA